MKTKLRRLPGLRLAVAAVLITLSAQLSIALAQYSAFTYQGRLNDGTNPANGSYDLQFTLYDSVTNGNVLGGPLTNTVTATNGLFTTTLDFGMSALLAGYPGSNAWLSIAARPIGGTNLFTSLVPRQRITAVPYAAIASAFAPDTTVQAQSLNIGDNGPISGMLSTIAGGSGNTITNYDPLTLSMDAIGGGQKNSIMNAGSAVIAGGASNTIAPGALAAAIGGGANNIASGVGAVVAGGQNNSASNLLATVSGGSFNTAIGDHATVVGGEQNLVLGSHAFIGGGISNSAPGDYSVICGGQGNDPGPYSFIGGGYGNLAPGYYEFIGSGYQNNNSGNYGVISGGYENIVSGNYSAISGGTGNEADQPYATIGGGSGNIIYPGAQGATIGGGSGNACSHAYSTVPGGYNNWALGAYSFAAGDQARATYDGSFVWADSTGGTFSSTGNNQFLIRAAGFVGIGTASPQAQLNVASVGYGVPQLQLDQLATTEPVRLRFVPAGSSWADEMDANPDGSLHFWVNGGTRLAISGNGNVGIGTVTPGYPLAMGSGAYCSAAGVWTSVSDRNAKEDFTAISPAEVLARLAALPITQWKYKAEPAGVKHIGPVAQDFHAAFGLGDNDKAIGTIDESGVALVAIQGLNQKLEQTRTENAELRRQVAELKSLVQQLAAPKAK